MTEEEKIAILNVLDFERHTVVYPGVTRLPDEGVIKDVYEGGKSCEIVYSSSSTEEVDHIIRRQIQTARTGLYDLEWKLYGHDQPPTLSERLIAAGFEAGDREAFMVLPATKDALFLFGNNNHDIRRITDRAGLADYQSIYEEVNSKSWAKQIEEYAFLLENHPDNMSIYVAYIDGEPASCGRIYFHPDSQFAGLYGGNTREKFRNRGLFTQVVAARIQEALSRGIPYITVDALPTSEPILRNRGFEIITHTQPFTL